eukprot:4935567-Alexandrium_andersonii.AAC.1
MPSTSVVSAPAGASPGGGMGVGVGAAAGAASPADTPGALSVDWLGPVGVGVPTGAPMGVPGANVGC